MHYSCSRVPSSHTFPLSAGSFQETSRSKRAKTVGPAASAIAAAIAAGASWVFSGIFCYLFGKEAFCNDIFYLWFKKFELYVSEEVCQFSSSTIR